MNQEHIGKFIATLRKEKNLTQEQLAEKLCVNVKSISRWETGRNLPDPSLMKELCETLDISINELFAGEKIKKNKKIKQIFLFYILVSLTGIFVFPTLGIIAPTFILSSILVPILGLIKLVAYFLNYDIPIIIVQLGPYSLNPPLGFLVCLITSGILYFIGMCSWKLLIKYIHFISIKKKKLYIEL